ncbi:helix-turn-helix domain-containing protein [Streptomyces sp. NPDC004270]
MLGQNNAAQNGQFSPAYIRSAWSGTVSVEEAARAFGLSRSKSYDLVRRGEFPCRVLWIGRAIRVLLPSPTSTEPVDHRSGRLGRARLQKRQDPTLWASLVNEFGPLNVRRGGRTVVAGAGFEPATSGL